MRLKFKYFTEGCEKEFNTIEGYFDRYELVKDQSTNDATYFIKVYSNLKQWENYDNIVFLQVDDDCKFELL